MNNSDATRKQPIDERIGDVERRLEIRRGRIEHDLDEIKERLSRKTTWVPLLAALGALAVGYAVARAQSATLHRAGSTCREADEAGGIVAVALGLVAGAMRFALSPPNEAPANLQARYGPWKIALSHQGTGTCAIARYVA